MSPVFFTDHFNLSELFIQTSVLRILWVVLAVSRLANLARENLLGAFDDATYHSLLRGDPINHLARL